MNKVNFTLRIDKTIHSDLKEKAYFERKSVNQLCSELLLFGLKKDMKNKVEEFVSNSDTEFLKLAFDQYDSRNFIVVLRTEGYVADYVLVLTSDSGFSESIERIDNKFVQMIKFPETVYAPNVMWVEIARTYKVLWSASNEEEKIFIKKLEEW